MFLNGISYANINRRYEYKVIHYRLFSNFFFSLQENYKSRSYKISRCQSFNNKNLPCQNFTFNKYCQLHALKDLSEKKFFENGLKPVQCSAITTKGIRCSRNDVSNSFCCLHLWRRTTLEILVENNTPVDSFWWLQDIFSCTFLIKGCNKDEVFFVRGVISTNYYKSILRRLEKFPVYFYTNSNVSPLINYKIAEESKSRIKGWDNYRILSRWVFKGGVPFVTKSLEESTGTVKKSFKIPEGPKTPSAIWLLNS